MHGGGDGSGAKTVANAGQIIYFFRSRLEEMVPDVSGGDQNDRTRLELTNTAGKDTGQRDMAGGNGSEALICFNFNIQIRATGIGSRAAPGMPW